MRSFGAGVVLAVRIALVVDDSECLADEENTEPDISFGLEISQQCLGPPEGSAVVLPARARTLVELELKYSPLPPTP